MVSLKKKIDKLLSKENKKVLKVYADCFSNQIIMSATICELYCMYVTFMSTLIEVSALIFARCWFYGGLQFPGFTGRVL